MRPALDRWCCSAQPLRYSSDIEPHDALLSSPLGAVERPRRVLGRALERQSLQEQVEAEQVTSLAEQSSFISSVTSQPAAIASS